VKFNVLMRGTTPHAKDAKVSPCIVRNAIFNSVIFIVYLAKIRGCCHINYITETTNNN